MMIIIEELGMTFISACQCYFNLYSVDDLVTKLDVVATLVLVYCLLKHTVDRKFAEN